LHKDLWAGFVAVSQRVSKRASQPKGKRHRFPVHFLSQPRRLRCGAAFLNGKAASTALLDLMMRKWNRFGGVLVSLLYFYGSELGGVIWQVSLIVWFSLPVWESTPH
jgi:hypothetical protein